ncbi:MAG: DUF938 domain-containing protein [Pseudomonadota bacterium]
MAQDENAAYPKGSDGRPVTLEAQEGDGARRFSPSVARNRDAIAEIYQKVMPRSGAVLEIGSGSGEHGVFFTDLFPELSWFFSDYDEGARDSIAAWIEHVGRAGLFGPYTVDATKGCWGDELEALRFDGLFSANVIHISPFSVTEGLLAAAGRLLHKGGRLFLYGPFARHGEMADSNRRFDEDLKRRDPSWGVRDIYLDLLPVAERSGLALSEIIPMPKNNHSVVFRLG